MFFRRSKTKPGPGQEAAEHDDALDGQALPQRLSPRSPSEAIKPIAAPPPPDRPERERGGMIGLFSGLLTLAVAAALAGMVTLTIYQRNVQEPGPLPADKVVVIPSHSGTVEIAETLAKEGVIQHTGLFEFAARFGGRPPLRAGEYLFKAHASIADTLDTLATGRQIQHSITFPEGLTSEQIVARLNDNDVLAGDISETPPEGSLLPDTYKFERGATRQMIVNLMKAKQKEVLNQIWQRRSADIPVKTPAELVTLASIVEKETGRADERPRVAAVFVNRLNKRMRLQSDPTIVYGLVGGGAPSGAASSARRSTGRRPTTPTPSRDCRRGRSPIPARRRWRRRPTRPAPATSTSWPTAPAAMPSPRPSTRTSATSPAGAPWRRAASPRRTRWTRPIPTPTRPPARRAPCRGHQRRPPRPRLARGALARLRRLRGHQARSPQEQDLRPRLAEERPGPGRTPDAQDAAAVGASPSFLRDDPCYSRPPLGGWRYPWPRSRA